MQHRFGLKLRCSGRYCELDSDDLEASQVFLDDLLNQALRSLPFVAFLEVQLRHDLFENMYELEMRISYFEKLKKPSSSVTNVQVEVEARVSNELLQVFLEVAVVDNSGGDVGV